MAATTLTTKGQCVVPKPIREHMQLHAGDRIDFVVKKDGEVVVRPVVLDVCKLKGLLMKAGRKSVSIKAMNVAVRKQGGRLA